MSGTIIQRNGRHSAKLTIAGTQLWLGTFKEHDHAQASIDRTVLSPHPTMTFNDLADSWCKRPEAKDGTHVHNRQMVEPFLRRHGNRPAASLIRLEAVAHTQANFGQARYLKALCQYGVELGVLPDNPFAGLKVTAKKKPKFPPTAEEIGRAKEAAQSVYADERAQLVVDLIETAQGTGLRLTELASLTPANVHRIEDRLRLLIVGKGDKDRVVAVPRSVASIIEQRMDGESLFAYRGRKLTRQTVHRLMKPVREKAGLEDMNWHLLRHKFATDMVNRGVQDRDLAIGMWGHHDTRLLAEVYSHPDREAAIRRIEEVLDV